MKLSLFSALLTLTGFALAAFPHDGLTARKRGLQKLKASNKSLDTSKSLSILSFNTFLFYKNIYPNWGQNLRAEAIGAPADFIKDHDVLVFQEAFEQSVTDPLQGNLAKYGYPYQTPVTGRSKKDWNATTGSWCSLCPASGGVFIASKHRIVEKRQHVFAKGCGTDNTANKGFAYVRLDMGTNQPLHVIGTHTQADDGGCSGSEKSVRATQFREIRQFVDTLPANEPVFVIGDMNVDKSSSEYNDMLSILGAKGADTFDGWPLSYDVKTNTIANERDPNGASAILDHVLIAKGGVKSGSKQTVLKVKMKPYEIKGKTYDDYSDHYPIHYTATL
ncbi:uncharacterized protein VTP21DRAFT_2202 [Calcarisporiella thermophila]|uniref:uncharacterized protein n=1 Tax=Calcarisporiella thermophila TaxID=911321 RepID=UPI0037429D65